MSPEQDSEQREGELSVEVGRASPSSTVKGAPVLRKMISFSEILGPRTLRRRRDHPEPETWSGGVNEPLATTFSVV